MDLCIHFPPFFGPLEGSNLKLPHPFSTPSDSRQVSRTVLHLTIIGHQGRVGPWIMVMEVMDLMVMKIETSCSDQERGAL